MEPTTVILGAIALAYIFANRGSSSAPEPKRDDKGVPDPNPPKPTTGPTVVNGVSSDAGGMTLKDAQTILIKWGYDMAPYGADGKYGPKTAAALKSFQKSQGIPETGIVDKATADALLYTTPPAPKDNLKALAYQDGYVYGATSLGMGNLADGIRQTCLKLTKSTTCPAGSAVADGFTGGFNKGAYDVGYSEGKAAADAGRSRFRTRATRPVTEDDGPATRPVTEDDGPPLASTNPSYVKGWRDGYDAGGASAAGSYLTRAAIVRGRVAGR